METPLGTILDEFNWGEDFTKPSITEFPFVDDIAFGLYQRCVRLDNINVNAIYDELGLEPSHEGKKTSDSYGVEIIAIKRDDFLEILSKVREACITYHGPYYNKIRVLDILYERRINCYYGKGVIECNKVGFEIYD